MVAASLATSQAFLRYSADMSVEFARRRSMIVQAWPKKHDELTAMTSLCHSVAGTEEDGRNVKNLYAVLSWLYGTGPLCRFAVAVLKIACNVGQRSNAHAASEKA